MSSKLKDKLSSVGLLLLRIGFGGYMMTHGWGKLQMVINNDLTYWQDPIGVGMMPSLVLATGAEFFCAFLVLIGLVTRFAAIPVVFTMAVAAVLVHGGDPWTMQPTGGSKEPALLFLTAFLTLVFTGGGKFALDSLVASKFPAPLRPFLN
jgi:putative oxidoreductase